MLELIWIFIYFAGVRELFGGVRGRLFYIYSGISEGFLDEVIFENRGER